MTDTHDSVPTTRFTPRRALFATALVVGLLIAAGIIWFRFSLSRTEFTMREAPNPNDLNSGGSASAPSSAAPYAEVARYPQFASATPLYGKLFFGPPDSRTVYYFAFDESKGTGKGRDVLYFDLNNNLDLTDDKFCRAVKRVLDAYRPSISGTLFAHLSLPCDYGPGIGVRAFTLEPCIGTDSSRASEWAAFKQAFVREGAIRIGGRRYQARLTQWTVTGRYDHPHITLTRPAHLVLFSHRGHPFDYVSSQTDSRPLDQMLRVENDWYSLSTTPLGDRLKVTRWEGDVGTFEIAGGLGDAEASGAISNTDSYLRITAHNPLYEFSGRSVKNLELPAGDYVLNNMLVTTGIYEIWLERNNATTGTYRWWKTAQPQYIIAIRAGEPFTLSLPDKPNVIFGMPDDRQRFRPGQTVAVRTMFVIPDTDVCIRDMNMRRTPLTVDVAVTDSSGQALARGARPILGLIYEGFSWQIPDDINLSGPEEKLTITVTLDTGLLFGKVEASREIIIEKPEGQ